MPDLFRVIADDATDEWLCTRGSRVFARCDTAVDALDRAAAAASLHRPSQVLFHDREGHVSIIANYPTPHATALR